MVDDFTENENTVLVIQFQNQGNPDCITWPTFKNNMIALWNLEKATGVSGPLHGLARQDG